MFNTVQMDLCNNVSFFSNKFVLNIIYQDALVRDNLSLTNARWVMLSEGKGLLANPAIARGWENLLHMLRAK